MEKCYKSDILSERKKMIDKLIRMTKSIKSSLRSLNIVPIKLKSWGSY